jgi:tetratricopeptide (TPR) repeat protein
MRVERLLSEVLRVQGAYEEARTCLSAMVATARELDILYEEILALASLVRLHCQLGDTGGARSWRDQLVERMTRTGVPHNCEAEGLRACAVYALCSGDEPRALADAERAWELAQRFNLLYGRADSAVILGHARAALHQPDAVVAYDEAVRLYLKIDNTASACEPQAGLAGLALAQGDGERARMLVDGLLPVLVERPRARVLTPFYAYTICYRVLAAHADPRAVLLLQTAQQHLRDAAGEISDPTLCQAFLEHPAAHRELLELAPPNALRA